MAEKPTLFTALTPSLLPLYDLQDAVIVVIDVFRATSTIAAALYNGAKYVIPVATVPEAIAIAEKNNGIAAGERDGKLADGMQHGNSPMEYARDFIQDRVLVLTTTNGTKLLYKALENGASEIVTGSFPNLSAVSNYLISKGKKVILACAGWKDRFNLEDAMFAGAVVAKVKQHFTIHCDSSLMVEDMYQAHQDSLLDFAKKFTHYHRLVNRFGYIEDISFCLTEDIANVLTVYENGKIIAKKNP